MITSNKSVRHLIEFCLFLIICIFTGACSNDYADFTYTSSESLQIKVSANDIETKSAIFSSYLPNNSNVWVWLTDSNGNSYNPSMVETLGNYISVGEDENQTWSALYPMPLDERIANVYAAYPEAGAQGLIVLNNNQIDYMYATPTTANRSKPLASIVMNHALSIIELSCTKNGTFSGAGVISAFRVDGVAISPGGKLDVKTGRLSDLNKGSTVEIQASELFLGDLPSVGHAIVIPNGVRGELTLSVKIDDEWYSVKTDPITLQQGKKYHYDLSISAYKMDISGLTVSKWITSDVGNKDFQVGAYKIKIQGDTQDIAFGFVQNSLGGIEVHAISTREGYSVASLYQEDVKGLCGYALSGYTVNNTRVQVVTVGVMEEDFEINFHGLKKTEWINITTDGVYYVGSDGLIQISPSQDCQGVVLVKSSKRWMIEKNEYNNASYLAAHKSYGGVNVDSDGNVSDEKRRKFTYGNYQVDLGMSKTDLCGSTPNCEPLYGANSTFPENILLWTDAMGDFNGYDNSTILKANPVNGDLSGRYENYNYTPVGHLLNEFIRSADALGYDDWYVPALGELCCIILESENINSYLTKIGGTPLDFSIGYWSSTEQSADGSYFIDYSESEDGIPNVWYWFKVVQANVRLVRQVY